MELKGNLSPHSSKNVSLDFTFNYELPRKNQNFAQMIPNLKPNLLQPLFLWTRWEAHPRKLDFPRYS